MTNPAAFLSEAAALLGPRGLTTDAELVAPWLTDWRGRFTGKALALASPADVGELAALVKGATLAHSLGLEVHAGHGLTYDNVAPIAAIPELRELNIGHFLIGEAIFMGLEDAIGEMRRRMDEARGTGA